MLKRLPTTRAVITTLFATVLGLAAWSQTPGRATQISRQTAKVPKEAPSGYLTEDSCGCDASKAIHFVPFTYQEIGGMMQPPRPNLSANDMVTVNGQTATASTILAQLNDVEMRLNKCGFSIRNGWDGDGPECKNELSPTDLATLNARKALVLGAHQWGRKGEVNPARNTNPGNWWTGGKQTSPPFPNFTNALNGLPHNSPTNSGQTTSLLGQTSTGVTWASPIRWVPRERAIQRLLLAPKSSDTSELSADMSEPELAMAPAFSPPPPPPPPSVVRSKGWDTGLIGRKDIYGAELHTEVNLDAGPTATNLDGDLKLTLWQFNHPYVHELVGAVSVPQTGAEQASLTYQDPSGNSVSLYQHTGPYLGGGSYNSGNLSMDFYLGVSCGPVVFYVTFTPSVQVKYDYTYYVGGGNGVPATSVAGGTTWGLTSIRPIIAFGEFKPRASVSVNASAAVTFLFVVTAGVSTDLKLVDWAMELRGLAKLDFVQTGSTYQAYAGLYTEGLDQILMLVNSSTPLPPFGTAPSGVGQINAFVKYPKLPQWFWNGSTRTAQRPIWSWNGIGASGWLVNYYLNYEQPF